MFLYRRLQEEKRDAENAMSVLQKETAIIQCQLEKITAENLRSREEVCNFLASPSCDFISCYCAPENNPRLAAVILTGVYLFAFLISLPLIYLLNFLLY